MSYYQLPPIRAFPHSISYREKTGEDDYQKPTYGDENIIDHVWFNLASSFSRSGHNSTEKTPNSSITMFKRYCDNIPKFMNDTPVVFEGKEYNIVLVKELILNGELIGLRLEVV